MIASEFDRAAIAITGTLSRYFIPLGICFAASYLVSWLEGYISILRQVRGLPTLHAILGCFEPGQRDKMPHIPVVCPVNQYLVRPDFDKYAKPRSDLIAYTALLYPRAVFVTTSPSTAAYIASKSSTFLKPLFMGRYTHANKIGLQIVSTQTGPQFRRHKNVVKGSFGEEIMVNAWGQTERALGVMSREERLGEGGVMRDVLEVLFKTTLLVIGSAGFGRDFSWHVEPTSKGQLSFREALDVVEQSIIAQLTIPSSIMRLIPSAKYKRYFSAQQDFSAHLYSMVRAKRAELASTTKDADYKRPTDLLGALVSSQMDVEGEARVKEGGNLPAVGLTEKEIIGNIFVFLLAGHETTGHNLAFTLSFLALYPEWQDKVHEELQQVCGDSAPSYRDMHKLPLCLAVCLESLRLRDLVVNTFMVAGEDTALPYTTWSADSTEMQQHTHFVKKGSLVVVDSAACQTNPFYWTDAMAFNPLRFVNNNKDAAVPYTAFSLGRRACIGKKFPEVEMAAFIAHLLKGYTVHPVPVKVGETWEEMRARMNERVTEELTLTPETFDLRFEERC